MQQQRRKKKKRPIYFHIKGIQTKKKGKRERKFRPAEKKERRVNRAERYKPKKDNCSTVMGRGVGLFIKKKGKNSPGGKRGEVGPKPGKGEKTTPSSR